MRRNCRIFWSRSQSRTLACRFHNRSTPDREHLSGPTIQARSLEKPSPDRSNQQTLVLSTNHQDILTSQVDAPSHTPTQITMAFLTAPALPFRVTARAPRCNTRMQDAAAEPVPIAPLNADGTHPMKEPYTVVVGKKAPICRCWQSAKFPLCNGAHNKFNKETGSNVGPLVVSAESEE